MKNKWKSFWDSIWAPLICFAILFIVVEWFLVHFNLLPFALVILILIIMKQGKSDLAAAISSAQAKTGRSTLRNA